MSYFLARKAEITGRPGAKKLRRDAHVTRRAIAEGITVSAYRKRRTRATEILEAHRRNFYLVAKATRPLARALGLPT